MLLWPDVIRIYILERITELSKYRDIEISLNIEITKTTWKVGIILQSGEISFEEYPYKKHAWS
jgi:hypothetical protein